MNGNRSAYPIIYAILITAIIFTVFIMIYSPTLMHQNLSLTRSTATDTYMILTLACTAALGMTLWLAVVGIFLSRWLPWLVSVHTIAVIALSAWVFFLGAGVEIYLQRIITLPPTLSLLLAILRLTPVLLLLTPLIPQRPVLALRSALLK